MGSAHGNLQPNPNPNPHPHPHPNPNPHPNPSPNPNPTPLLTLTLARWVCKLLEEIVVDNSEANRKLDGTHIAQVVQRLTVDGPGRELKRGK